MDTRLWGGPLGILKQQYTTVHNNTPQSAANDGSSSSDEELDYHKLMERMTGGSWCVSVAHDQHSTPPYHPTTATAKPSSKQYNASSSVRVCTQFLFTHHPHNRPQQPHATQPATTSAVPDHRNTSPLSVALNLSTQFSEAQDSPSAPSPGGSPGLVITPPRLHAAGYGDEVPSPSPVAWPSTQGRSFGRDDDDDAEQSATPWGAPTPNSGVSGLEIAPPPLTSFSNLSHPLSSPPASPQPSPSQSGHMSSPTGPRVRQFLSPTREGEPFTFSDAKQHCSPLHGNSLRVMVGQRDGAGAEEDDTPFARDGWDAAVHQQQPLEQHPQHAQHGDTAAEEQVLSGHGIRAAGSVTRVGGGGGGMLDAQRKHTAGGRDHAATKGKGTTHPGVFSSIPRPSVRTMGTVTCITCMVLLASPFLPWDAIPSTHPIVQPLKAHMQQSKLYMLSGIDTSTAALKQWQAQVAGMSTWSTPEWVLRDMGMQHYNPLHMVQMLYNHLHGVAVAQQHAMHAQWKWLAAPGPIITWHQAAQAQQWDQELSSQLHRAGYLATRLVRWHTPTPPPHTPHIHAPPTNPPQQAPTPAAPPAAAAPLDTTPTQGPPAYDWTWYADHPHLPTDTGVEPSDAGIDIFAPQLDQLLTYTPVPASSPSPSPSSSPSPLHTSSLQSRLSALPPPLKTLLRASITLLRWTIAICYWAALTALGGSMALAGVLTVLHALPEQRRVLVRSLSEASTGWAASGWVSAASGTSVFAAVPGAAREASAALARSLSTSFTALQAALPFSNTHSPNFTWLRPNMVVPRAAAARGAMLYRLLRNRLYMIPGIEHLTAATRGRELGALLRQLTPTSPLFGFRMAVQHATPEHAPTTKATSARKGGAATQRTPATPRGALGASKEDGGDVQGATGRRGGKSASKSAVKSASKASAPRSSTRQRRTAASSAAAEEMQQQQQQKDSPALGTRSATRRAVRT